MPSNQHYTELKLSKIDINLENIRKGALRRRASNTNTQSLTAGHEANKEKKNLYMPIKKKTKEPEGTQQIPS